MGDLGFWALAQEDPDHLALVTPEGEDVTAGELLGRANQLVHALRGIGFETGDVVATLLPNGAEMIEIYLAALQAGWYLVPINHHLVAPEVAYILKDSGAKTFVSHERFADAAVAAADEAGIAPAGRLAVGTIPGFASYSDLRDACPTTHARGPDHRRRHELHVGDDGQPEGDLPQARRGDARGGRARAVGAPLPVRGPTPGRQRAHRGLAPVPHRRAALRQRVDFTWVTPSSSWTSGCPRRCSGSSKSVASRLRTWCRHSSTASSRCPTTSEPGTTCPRCVT